MIFTQDEEWEIYNFIVKYNNDQEYMKKVQETYLKEPLKLSMLYIYALEQILRFGNKDIFKRVSELSDDNTKQISLGDVNLFINLYYNDDNFKNYKLDQLQNNPDSLSKLEKGLLDLIQLSQEKSKDVHDAFCDALFEYDPYNPILYNTDDEIKGTLTNLFIGQFIHQLLETPEWKPIKVRQKESGMIANEDKSFVIENIQNYILNSYSKIEAIVLNRFVPVKFNVLLGKGEEAFSEYLKYNTNISINEVLEYRKNNKSK